MTKPKTKLEVQFRKDHLLGRGGCVLCGVSQADLERWPTLQCMPECRPHSVWAALVGGGEQTVYDAHDAKEQP